MDHHLKGVPQKCACVHDTTYITNKGSNMKALEKYHIYKGNTNEEIILRTDISQLKTKCDIIDEYETPLGHLQIHIVLFITSPMAFPYQYLLHTPSSSPRNILV
jgi:hypothetical protein